MGCDKCGGDESQYCDFCKPEYDRLYREAKEDVFDEVSQATFKAHTYMLALHTKALACHCECLGMNAENSWAICRDFAPPYTDVHYSKVMQKWGLIDEKGEPTL